MNMRQNSEQTISVAVGSRNPVKISATRKAFSLFYPNPRVTGITVCSGVPAQPRDEAQTLRGARNRAVALTERVCVDYYVGIEGGLACLAGRWFVFGAICVRDHQNLEFWGTSPYFQVPTVLLPGLAAGAELGVLVDELVGQNNSKQNGGAIGFLTRGVMDRCDFYVGGLICALAPHLQPALYSAAAAPVLTGEHSCGGERIGNQGGMYDASSG